MTRGPGWLFVGGLIVFALLGVLAGAPPPQRSPSASAVDVPRATDVSPRGMPMEPTPGRVTSPSTRSPGALARSWGNLSANWSQRTLPSRLRAMAGTASSTLAAELERALSAGVHDGQLASEGSRGVVEAVEVQGAGSRRRLLVVTRETPLAAAAQVTVERYRIYVGVAVRLDDGGWRMERWHRQP
jgi:hypothetical protein